ncbi:MAG: DUF3524 domain-containing protein [Candidatus Krumholzibacteriota bacterium]|nr:DUF3524 domain-containing protein [Candidatus Krumholzibacteriota bacterium]
MRIVILEPWLAGSHGAWASGYAARSAHEVSVLGLPGRHWKWRMHGGAVTLARRYREEGHGADLLLATDMCDLALFLALTRDLAAGTPAAVFFHENQLTYPWPGDDPDPALGRDVHYAFVNLASALAADAVFFNSPYHMADFLGALPGFLGAFPDFRERGAARAIEAKSRVLPLGIDLAGLDRHRVAREPGATPLILWNHRWEYDKGPEEFFRALRLLAGEGLDFRVTLLGESGGERPAVFEEAQETLGSRIVHRGFAPDRADYARWLWRADILPVTARHEFFGTSVVEGMYCGVCPVLPRRLAYPGHIPEERHGEFLYDGFDGLVTMLRRRIERIDETRTAGARSFAERYDWATLAPAYDAALEAVAGH